MSDKWLEPQQESEEQKAERRRRAKESPPTARHAVRQLDAMKSKPPAAPAPLHQQQRLDPKAIIEGEEPQPVSEKPDPPVLAASGSVPPVTAAAPASRPDPDPRLVEIARTWSWLSERDREELLLIVRVKAHLNQKAAGK